MPLACGRPGEDENAACHAAEPGSPVLKQQLCASIEALSRVYRTGGSHATVPRRAHAVHRQRRGRASELSAPAVLRGEQGLHGHDERERPARIKVRPATSYLGMTRVANENDVGRRLCASPWRKGTGG